MNVTYVLLSIICLFPFPPPLMVVEMQLENITRYVQL